MLAALNFTGNNSSGKYQKLHISLQQCHIVVFNINTILYATPNCFQSDKLDYTLNYSIKVR